MVDGSQRLPGVPDDSPTKRRLTAALADRSAALEGTAAGTKAADLLDRLAADTESPLASTAMKEIEQFEEESPMPVQTGPSAVLLVAPAKKSFFGRFVAPQR
jgi:hypothetical protein